MNVKDTNFTIPTLRMHCSTLPTQPISQIIPKHKKSISSLHCIPSFTPLTENKILTALTPRKLIEAQYRQKDSFDSEFNKNLEKNFKENLELKEKRKKFEERKRKEEEFLALKEAKNRIRLEELQRNKDDRKREMERMKRNQLLAEEKKMRESQFEKDRRALFNEFITVKRKIRWEGEKREREMSVDSLRARGQCLNNCC